MTTHKCDWTVADYTTVAYENAIVIYEGIVQKIEHTAPGQSVMFTPKELSIIKNTFENRIGEARQRIDML